MTFKTFQRWPLAIWLVAVLAMAVPSLAGITYSGTTAQTLYARVQTGASTFVAAAMTEGSSGGLGIYNVSDSSLVSAGLTTASGSTGYQYTIRSGSASTTANDTILGYGVIYWAGSTEGLPIATAISDPNRRAMPPPVPQPGTPTPYAPFVYDTMAQPSQVGLASHTGELGATWTKHTSFSSGDLQVINGRVFGNYSGVSVFYASGAPSIANYFAEGTVHVNTLLAGTYIGVVVRSNSAAPQFYMLVYNVSSAAWELYSLNTGGTLLGSYSQTLVAGSDYTARLECYGRALRCIIDGVPRIEVRETTWSSAGVAGIVSQGVATTSTGLHLQGFRAGQIVPQFLAVSFGDSITYGTGLSYSGLAYPNKLNLGPEWYAPHIGVNAKTLAAMLTDVADVTALVSDAALKERVTVVYGGTNDLAAGSTAAQVWASAQSIGTAIRNAGGKAIYVTPLSRGDTNIDTTRAALVALARAGWTSYYDGLVVLSDDAFIGYDGAWLDSNYFTDPVGDKVHPNPNGAARIAYRVQAAIEAVGSAGKLANWRVPIAGPVENTFGNGVRLTSTERNSTADAILDRALSGHTTAGTVGNAIYGAGSVSTTSFNDEAVPPNRTWKLKPSNQSDEVLVGESTLKLTVGKAVTFAADFAVDLPTNGRVESVDTVAIFSGTDGGVTFGTSGREDSEAKVRITGVTAGTYVVQFDVTYDNGDTQTARVTLKVVD
jgi:lysophospholipase L1-like esterase